VSLALVLAAAPTLAGWLQTPEGAPWPSRVSVTPTGAGPVVADVSGLAARGFALTDTAGAPVVFGVTDADANGTGDELAFVAQAGQPYYLYLSPEPGPTDSTTAGVQVSAEQAGSWLPLRLPPVNARAAPVTLAAAREANAGTAAQVLQSLTTDGPMIQVSTAAWEIWIGGHSGLIERLRPTGHPWAGSAGREWAANLPNTPASGETRVEAQGAARVLLRHSGDVVRDLEVWADGTILTTGDAALTELRLVVGALPYEALRAGAGGAVLQFGDVSDTGRTVDADVLGWTTPDGSALTCQPTGARFGSVAAQTQGDDVMSLLAMRLTEGFDQSAGRLTRPLIPAAFWECGLTELSEGEPVRLDYFPRDLAQAPGGRFGVQQARLGFIQGPPARAEAPEQDAPAVAVGVRRLDGPVVCLQPGRGLSPRLEPYPLAPENPPVAWFEVTVRAPLGADRVQLAVEAAPWLERVETAEAAAPLAPTVLRREADRYTTSAPVVEGSATCRLGLKAAEGQLGVLTATLRVTAPGLAALAGLRAEVEPGIPLFVLGPSAVAAGKALPQLGPSGATDVARPRRRVAEPPAGLADPRVWEADMPLLAVADEAAARALRDQWQAAVERLRGSGAATGEDHLLAASLLPAEGPESSYASLRRLAWVCWSLGLTEGGLGWRAAQPLVWETKAGLLPTDRLLAIRDTAEDVRLLAWAQARQAPQDEAVRAALAGNFSAARQALRGPRG
jgi:hypothetical protein